MNCPTNKLFAFGRHHVTFLYLFVLLLFLSFFLLVGRSKKEPATKGDYGEEQTRILSFFLEGQRTRETTTTVDPTINYS